MQELAADPVVQTHTLGDFLDIRTDVLAQIRDLVDEGDLHRQESVGRILDQFRGPPRSEHDRRLVEEERAVQLAHQRPGAVVIGTDDHTVRPLEIVNRCPFAQEFRVGNNGEIGVRSRLADDPLDLVARPHRHRGLGHHDRIAVHHFGHLLGSRIDIGQVGIAIAAARRCPHGNENRIGRAHGIRDVLSEAQTAFADITLDQKIQTRFIDRDPAGVEHLDLGRILVDTYDLMSEVGETGPRHQSDIARSDHRHAHASLLFWSAPVSPSLSCGARPKADEVQHFLSVS